MPQVNLIEIGEAAEKEYNERLEHVKRLARACVWVDKAFRPKGIFRLRCPICNKRLIKYYMSHDKNYWFYQCSDPGCKYEYASMRPFGLFS